jgi:predicted helicase
MASRSKAATITPFFSPLSKEEIHKKIKKDSVAWQEEERNRIARNEVAKAAKESVRLATKRPVGRPKRVKA